jgi:hypothetical protein
MIAMAVIVLGTLPDLTQGLVNCPTKVRSVARWRWARCCSPLGAEQSEKLLPRYEFLTIPLAVLVTPREFSA